MRIQAFHKVQACHREYNHEKESISLSYRVQACHKRVQACHREYKLVIKSTSMS